MSTAHATPPPQVPAPPMGTHAGAPHERAPDSVLLPQRPAPTILESIRTRLLTLGGRRRGATFALA